MGHPSVFSFYHPTELHFSGLLHYKLMSLPHLPFLSPLREDLQQGMTLGS